MPLLRALPLTFFLVFSFPSLLFSNSLAPPFGWVDPWVDPDEMMDAIGNPPTRQKEEDGPKLRSGTNRENLGSGMFNSNAGNDEDGGRNAVIANLGILYVAGRTKGANNDFLILKYFPDGSLDTSFDTDGLVTHSFGNSDDVAHAIALQTNGSIVVAGRSDAGVAGEFEFAVLRLLSNGNLDTTFHTDGKNIADLQTGADIARGVAIDTNGSIVLGGYSKNSTPNYDFGFARFLSSGALDTSFATDGTATIANGTSDDGALSLALDSNGMMIGGGNSYNGVDWDFAAVRLLTSGSLDSSFNTNGKYTAAIGSANETAYGVALGTTNEVILAGAADVGAGNMDIALIRLLTSGTLDTTFDTDGKKTQAVGSDNDGANGIALQTNGTTILVAGYSYGSNNDFMLARFKSDASLDTSFATDGSFTQAVLSAEDTAQGITMKGDGLIMAVGRANTGGTAFDIAVVRLQSDGSLARSGQLNKSFATGGKLTHNFGTSDQGVGCYIHTDGKTIITATAAGDFALVRLNADGSLDTTFSTNGDLTRNVNGDETASIVTMQSDGKYIVIGHSQPSDRDIAVLRFFSDGGIDTSFHTDGIATKNFNAHEYIDGGALQTDGKIVVVPTPNNAGNHSVFRFETNGELDTSFFTDGDNSFAAAGENDRGLLVDTSGRIVVSGLDTSFGSSGTNVRWLSDGTLDTSFGTDGSISYNIGSASAGKNIGLQHDGKMVTVGSASGSVDIALIRVLTDGTLDTSFLTDGSVVYDVTGGSDILYSVILGPNSKILAAGIGANDFLLVRYLSDGVLDTTFATSGKTTLDFDGGSDPVSQLTIGHDGRICLSGSQTNTDAAMACYWQ